MDNRGHERLYRFISSSVLTSTIAKLRHWQEESGADEDWLQDMSCCEVPKCEWGGEEGCKEDRRKGAARGTLSVSITMIWNLQRGWPAFSSLQSIWM